MRPNILFLLRFRIAAHCQPFLWCVSSSHHHSTLALHSSSTAKKGQQMQNPLDMETYRVGAETYRRNCPLETVSTVEPAVGVTLGAKSDDEAFWDVAKEQKQTLSPTSSTRHSSSSENRPAADDLNAESSGKKIRVSSDGAALITAKVAREIGEVPGQEKQKAPFTVERKTVEVVSTEDGCVYTEKVTEEKQLVGTVRYDEKEQYFYDSLRVPTTLVGMIRGAKSSKQKQIEEQNRCQIYFPKKPKTEGTETEIKLTSTESALHVQACGEALNNALMGARRAARPTHFISVPIFDIALRNQYSKFVDKICNDKALPSEIRNKKMFMTPSKLHLTLNVLKLFTDEEVQEIRNFLNQQFQSEKIREILRDAGGRFRIEFKTLQQMVRQASNKCSVLFAQPEAEGLQQLVNALDDALAEAGMVKRREGNDVLLHMTVLNTKYLWQGRKTIDATPMLERYGQLQFNPVDVEELHLCEMRGNSNADDLNGYVSVHSVNFAMTAN